MPTVVFLPVTDEAVRISLVQPDMPLMEVIRHINDGALQIALVEGGVHRLLGTITDGDIRRAILAGARMETTPARTVMNPNPITVGEDVGGAEAWEIMQRHNVHALPALDSAGRLAGLFVLETFAPHRHRLLKSVDAVLMVGGKGERLRPYTENVPKPMLPLRGKPMLEHIVERLVHYGIDRIWMAVNYKADVIEEYFGSGEKFHCGIRYVREKQPLGTGGALSLLPREELAPRLLVMNGDVVTDVNFHALLDFHERCGAAATMCVSRYKVEVPFGVVQTDGFFLSGIEEKPSSEYFINAGIYVMNRSLLNKLPYNEPVDTPEFLEKIVHEGDKVAVFPLHEKWQDVGTVTVYEKCR